MMSPAPAPRLPAPLARLLDHLTVEQVEALAAELAHVTAVGYGEVALQVERGEVQFIKTGTSRDVRRSARRPRPA